MNCSIRKLNAKSSTGIKIWALIFCASIALAGCGKEDETQAEITSEPENTDHIIPEKQKRDPNKIITACDSQSNLDVDCECTTQLVEGAWHDDPDLDMATILTKSVDEFSQASIDVIIDVAVEADNKCAN